VAGAGGRTPSAAGMGTPLRTGLRGAVTTKPAARTQPGRGTAGRAPAGLRGALAKLGGKTGSSYSSPIAAHRAKHGSKNGGLGLGGGRGGLGGGRGGRGGGLGGLSTNGRGRTTSAAGMGGTIPTKRSGKHGSGDARGVWAISGLVGEPERRNNL